MICAADVPPCKSLQGGRKVAPPGPACIHLNENVNKNRSYDDYGIMGLLSFAAGMKAHANAMKVESMRATQVETKIRFCNSRLTTVIRTALREIEVLFGS